MFRRFIHFCLWGSGLALMCLAYGFLIEPRLLKIRHVDMASPGWTGAPLRIALVSDIHMAGHHMTQKRVDILIEAMNEQAPDIILIPGDFVNGHDKRSDRSVIFNRHIDEGLKSFGRLQSRYGVYASLGNHDAWYDSNYIERGLRENGITVLENDAAFINARNLCVVGLEDEWTGTPNQTAFEMCPEASQIIAFMHSPDSFNHIDPRSALVLAGHTHGGQINIPGIGRRVTATEAGKDFAYGQVKAGDVPAFVTAGVGTSILPARFRAPPEVVIITLTEEKD